MTTVHESRNYDEFSFLNGNRDINSANYNRLLESHKVEPLTSIIIVNAKKEIIDGQHRFLVRKELGLPIEYIIKRDYGLKHVHVYNQNTKNWTLNEFMDSYSKMGLKDYQTYRWFKGKYKFGHAETIMLLSGENSWSSRAINRFKDGFFRVKSLSSAVCMADKINEFSPYYDGFRRKGFVCALLKLMKGNPEYDHAQMLQKISYQSARLTDQPTISDYLSVLEKIYNYKTRSEYVRFDIAA